MTLSNSKLKVEEYIVDCRDSVCSEEIFLGFLDSVQLMALDAFGLQCTRCHKKWVYDKSNMHLRTQI
jgi:hypothetical protein